jgi:hypothetical protein
MSRPSNTINEEVIRILIIIIEGDFKALFLINVSVRKERGRLIVLALLDIECRLSVVINYQLVEQLYERLQIDIIDLIKSILISNFVKEIHQLISQALYLFIHINEH